MTPATDAGPARLMMRLGQRGVQHINRADRRTGALFEIRFRAQLLENDGDLLACHRSIEPNRVRARMVRTAEEEP